jgi:hypothetical protein
MKKNNLQNTKQKGKGRPKLYSEETMQVGFRVPKNKEKEFRNYASKKLKSWQI